MKNKHTNFEIENTKKNIKKTHFLQQPPTTNLTSSMRGWIFPSHVAVICHRRRRSHEFLHLDHRRAPHLSPTAAPPSRNPASLHQTNTFTLHLIAGVLRCETTIGAWSSSDSGNAPPKVFVVVELHTAAPSAPKITPPHWAVFDCEHGEDEANMRMMKMYELLNIFGNCGLKNLPKEPLTA